MAILMIVMLTLFDFVLRPVPPIVIVEPQKPCPVQYIPTPKPHIPLINSRLRIYVFTPPELPDEFLFSEEDFEKLRHLTHLDQYIQGSELYHRLLDSPLRTTNITDAHVAFVVSTDLGENPSLSRRIVDWAKTHPMYNKVPMLLMYTWAPSGFYGYWELAPGAMLATTEPMTNIPFRRGWDIVIPYSAQSHQHNWVDRERVVNGERPNLLYFRGRPVGPRPRSWRRSGTYQTVRSNRSMVHRATSWINMYTISSHTSSALRVPVTFNHRNVHMKW